MKNLDSILSRPHRRLSLNTNHITPHTHTITACNKIPGECSIYRALHLGSKSEAVAFQRHSVDQQEGKLQGKLRLRSGKHHNYLISFIFIFAAQCEWHWVHFYILKIQKSQKNNNSLRLNHWHCIAELQYTSKVMNSKCFHNTEARCLSCLIVVSFLFELINGS